MKLRLLTIGIFSAVLFSAGVGPCLASTLLERAKAGETVRIGFSTEVPYAYPSKDGKPLGFVNQITLDVLKKMGITNVESVVTDWGGLIPGLNASRFDIITGGMDITGARCANVSFSMPVSKTSPALLVAEGNPKGLNTYQDIKDKGATAVTVAGYSMVEHARKVGIPDENLMQVPGTTEELAAIKAGRVDAVIDTNITLNHLVGQTDGAFEVTDPSLMPEEFQNWTGIAFRNDDKEFLDAFNEVLKTYVGSPEMLKAVAAFEYVESQLPGTSTTEWICSNR